MKEVFLRLLNSYVKPNNPKIDSFHLYTLGTGDNNMYIVQVKSYYDLTKEDKNNIREDISSVYHSLGLPKSSDFMVTYAKINS